MKKFIVFKYKPAHLYGTSCSLGFKVEKIMFFFFFKNILRAAISWNKRSIKMLRLNILKIWFSIMCSIKHVGLFLEILS